MTITPSRLLLLCIVLLLLFYGFHDQKSHRPIPAASEFRMADGSIVVTMQGPRFTIDPLYGIETLASAPSTMSPPRVPRAHRQMPEDIPGLRPSMPAESSLLGEVARSAVDGHVSNLRMLAVSGLLAPQEPPVVLAALSAPPAAPATTKPPTSPRSVTPPPSLDEPSGSPNVPTAMPAAPSSAAIEKELARARRLLGDDEPRQAMDILVTLLATASEAPLDTVAEIHFTKAKAHRSLNEPSNSLTEHRRAIELVPNVARYLNGLAWALVTIKPSRLRNPAEAVDLATRAVTMTDRRTANYLDTLAKSLFALGRAEQALQVQQEAVDLEPDNRSFARRLKYYEEIVAAD